MEHEGDKDTDCNWGTWDSPPKIGNGTENLVLKEQVETIQTSVF